MTEGLVALYTFEEGAGNTVRDVSDVAPPLDLTIQNPSAVAWAPGKLVVAMPTLITSGGAATKVIERCKQTNEITLDAWIAPASADLFGPARILTNSLDTSQRNFQLGQQYASFYQARIRSTLSVDPNGSPFLDSPVDAGHVELALTHLLVTRGAGGSSARRGARGRHRQGRGDRPGGHDHPRRHREGGAPRRRRTRPAVARRPPGDGEQHGALACGGGACNRH